MTSRPLLPPLHLPAHAMISREPLFESGTRPVRRLLVRSRFYVRSYSRSLVLVPSFIRILVLVPSFVSSHFRSRSLSFTRSHPRSLARSPIHLFPLSFPLTLLHSLFRSHSSVERHSQTVRPPEKKSQTKEK